MSLINNMYHMLSYTFVTLNNKSYNKCAVEEYKTMVDLFASILIKGIKSQFKRGVIRDYETINEVTHNVRGKIDIQSSINANYSITQKYACEVDELTINSKPNQMLKATLKLLLKSNVSPKIKREIKSILMIFSSVRDVNVSNINWNIHFNSSNQTYRLLLTICNLVVYGLDGVGDTNKNMLDNFFDEDSMCVLFKQFVIEYYRRHHKIYRLLSPNFEWNITGKINVELLPTLQADLYVSNYEKRVVILTRYNKTEIDKNDILLLNSIVKNIDTNNTGDISGVLLYGATEQTQNSIKNEKFSINKNKIIIKSIDLSDDFERVKNQLENIISIIK